jgi:hypothetical protein
MPRQSTIEALYSQAKLTAAELDHVEWSRAQPIHITHKWSGEAAPASRHAEARILWTNEFLIVRFVCRQEEPLTLYSNPQIHTKTPRLWDRDVCEIFLAPDPDTPERYFEFEASPAGEWVDIAITFTPTGRETSFEFQSGMKAAASIHAKQTIICMAIPWSLYIPQPTSGDRWRVNLFRCVGLGDERYLAWQPTYTDEPNFHVPEVFGELEFS